MYLLRLNKEEIKAFLWILGISIFGLISLFQANTLYMDDYSRIVYDQGWNYNGRPLATFVTLILQLGRPFTDISPLPQFIAIALFSLGIIYLGRIFKIENLVILTLIGVITILNPFNLSMYAFVFDAFPMILGILSSMMALYLVIKTIENNQNLSIKIQWYFVSIIFLIISLCLYQTSISFYFIGYIFYLLNQLSQDKHYKKSLINFFIFATILLSSMILYNPLKNLYELSPYTIKSGEIPTINNFASTIINNVIKAGEISKYYLGNSTIFYLFLSLLLFLFLVIFINIFFTDNKNYTHQSYSRKLGSTIVALFYYLIIITSLIFPSYILVNPPWHTRIFLGITAIICFSCFYIANFFKKYDKIRFFRYLIIFYFSLITLSLINLSLTYGNVLSEQNLYEERIATLLLNDIENLINEKSIILDKPKIVFINTQNISNIKTNKLIATSLQKYPIISSLAQPYLMANNFGIEKLESFSFDFERLSKEDFFQNNKNYYQPNKAPILQRQLYNIYLENNDVFIITFNK